MAPSLLFVLRVTAPGTAEQAGVVLRIAWLCATSGMIALLVLVGALAPIVRSASTASSASSASSDVASVRGASAPSQLEALRRGLVGLVRAIVPAAIVLCAVAMGLVALAIPGVLLYGLFVLAPASEARGVSAKMAASIAIVRARWRAIAGVIALTMLALAAVVAIQQLLLPTPLGKAPTKVQLAMFPQMVRIVGFAMMVIVPAAAWVLASIDASHRATVEPVGSTTSPSSSRS